MRRTRRSRPERRRAAWVVVVLAVALAVLLLLSPRRRAEHGVPVVVQFSPEAGFCEAPFDLTLSCPGPAAAIRYTLDGSEPSARNGIDYSGPLRIERNSVVRAAAFRLGAPEGRALTRSYLFDDGQASRAVPTVSIVGDPHDSLYEPNGIMGSGQDAEELAQENVLGRGKDFERPVSVEYLPPDATPGFSTGCGIRIHGGDLKRINYVRAVKNEKSGEDTLLSFRLYFRGKYGVPRVEYPLFDDSLVETFNCLILRANLHEKHQCINNELTSRLFADCGYLASHARYVNLFINGEYQGDYTLCERPDDSFFRAHYGSDRKWDILTQEGIRNGDVRRWKAMIDFAKNHDLANDADYEEMGRYLDIEAFTDYIIVETYAAHSDWPWHNWLAARERTEQGVFRFYVWDAQATFIQVEYNPLAEIDRDRRAVGVLFRALEASPRFRGRFGARVQALFADGGPLCTANVMRRYEELRDQAKLVAPDINTKEIEDFIAKRQDLYFGLLGQLMPRENDDRT